MHNAIFLVVDDCATTRLVISSIIRNSIGSKNIFVATDGENACEIIRNHNVDIIISDWDMPVMGGEKLLSEIRSNPDTKEVPVIILSTEHDNLSMEKAIALGATQHLEKPVKPEDLETKLRLSWNGTNKRMAKRFAFLPQYDSMLQVDSKALTVDIINISRTGVLLRMIYSKNLDLFGTYDFKLTVNLPDKHKILSLDPIIASCIRIEREVCKHAVIGRECYLGPSSGGCTPDACRLCNVAMSFNLDDMDRKVLSDLNDFIEWLNDRAPDVVENC